LTNPTLSLSRVPSKVIAARSLLYAVFCAVMTLS
jgi:hypothetical protein